jgi:hypothetical protein
MVKRMSNRGARTDDPVALADRGVEENSAAQMQALAQRVGRLEDAVAGLQDTRMLEERVVARVGERLQHTTSAQPRDSAGLLIEAGRRWLPTAIETLRSQPSTVEGVARLVAPPPARRHWLVFDLYDELRTIFAMLRDLRYRPYLSWTACLAPPLLLIAILTSGYWLRLLPGGSLIADTPIDKLLDFILGLFVYKILAREARRYQAMVKGET